MAEIINGTSGNDNLTNTVSGAVINALGGNDFVTTTARNTSISGGDGADTIRSEIGGSDHNAIISISGGTGNDYIYHHHGCYVTLDGGEGNDTIENNGNANNYNDIITINGGAGNDSIINGGNTAKIDGGDGNDTIDNRREGVSVSGGVGDDLIINRTVTAGGGYNDTINPGRGNDKVSLVGSSKNNLIQYANGDGNDTIWGLGATDSISISGSKYSSTKSNGNIIITVGTGNITLVGAASLSTANIIDGDVGVTINNTVSNKTLNGTAYNDSINNTGGNVKIYASGGNDTIWSTNGSRANVTMDGGAGDDRLELWGTKSSINGGEGNDTIFTHTKNATILGGAGNDYVENWDDNVGRSDDGDGKDIILTGSGNDSVRNFGSGATINTGKDNDVIWFSSHNRNGTSYPSSKNVVQYANGDGNDTIYSFGTTDSLSITGGNYTRSTVGNDVIVKVGSGSVKLVGAKGKNINIIGGETTLTITDKTKSPVTLASTYTNADASTRTKAAKITGNDSANSILGGKAADTLGGGTGNDTLTGGKGNDVFIYSAGKDVITDYATGDKISLGADVSKTSLSGSDVVFTIGKGSLTVKNGKGKTLSMIDKSGNSYETVIGGGTTLTVTDKTKSPVKLGSSYEIADASTRTKAVKITGNALDNSIVGGKGNDTLDGGLGNDSLWGNAGADVFLYSDGEGKDVIFGFDNSDMLLITGAFTGTYNKSNKELLFKVGSTANAITLKDFTATTFNVNGYDYGISGTKLVKK